MALDPILARRLHEVGLRRHLQGRLDTAAAALGVACLVLAALRVGLWLFGPAVAAAHPLPALWLAVPLGALIAGGSVWWRRRRAAPSPLETARFLDRELRLEDRLATAVELYGPQADARPDHAAPRGAVGALLHYDAAAHAQRVDPETAVPPRWPEGLGRLCAGLLAAVIVLLPIFPASPLRPQAPSAAAAEQALMRARGEEIQQLAEQLQAQAKAEPDSAAGDMAAQLQSLAQQMIGSQLTPEQAERLLNQLQARLSTVDRERANAALSQLEAAQRAGISPDEMRTLAEKLTEAASQPTPPSLAQQSELARQLQALQDRLGGDSSLSRALQRIAGELKNGDVAQAARDLSALNRQLSAQQQAAQNV
ncbi:MAG TPA: hypothetical protein VFK80_04950, partial [Limnochordia bacterium]|nr:hypothetical protein [Limnochordia bacterium]